MLENGAVAFIESPTLTAWGIFWLYLIFSVLAVYYLVNMFKREQIIYGHLDELFQVLTRIRIWSIRYRKTYTLLVTGLLCISFLTIVYFSEIAHSILFKNQLAFSSLTDYLRWIAVYIASGFTMGEPPRSFLAVLLSGVFPLFIIGSVITIVRLTSKSAHNSLIKRMAEGDSSSRRVIIFNYREEYDQFIRSLLNQSNAFVVIFAKESHMQDANSFIEGIERTDAMEYHTAVEELSYSEDVLFDQYSILEADEVYIFPDVENRTDYENLRLIARLNREAKIRMENPKRDVEPPNTVWLADSRKLSGVAQNLEETLFKQRLHAMSFQDDIRDLIRSNTSDTIPELEKYFNFTEEVPSPEWIEGFSLDNYSLRPDPLTEDEKSELNDIQEYRLQISQDMEESLQQSKLTEMREQTLRNIEDRLQTEVEKRSSNGLGTFFGLLADVASATIPITFSSAYSQQIETATHALQVRKNTDGLGSKETVGGSEGNVFIVNYNSKIRDYVLSFDDYESDTDRYLTVFSSESQVTPDSTERTNFAEYRSINDLLEMLFNETDRSPRHVKAGDTIILLLDYTIPSPKINVLRALDAIDDMIRFNSTDINHNDIFLCVESDVESKNEEYRYLAVDKIIETQRTQRFFLRNLIQIRTSDVVKKMIKEGKISQHQAFGWAVETAHYFREFQIEACHRSHKRQYKRSESVVGKTLEQLIDERAEYGQRSALPFTTFNLHRDEDGQGIVAHLNEPTLDKRLQEDEFLISFPHI